MQRLKQQQQNQEFSSFRRTLHCALERLPLQLGATKTNSKKKSLNPLAVPCLVRWKKPKAARVDTNSGRVGKGLTWWAATRSSFRKFSGEPDCCVPRRPQPAKPAVTGCWGSGCSPLALCDCKEPIRSEAKTGCRKQI